MKRRSWFLLTGCASLGVGLSYLLGPARPAFDRLVGAGWTVTGLLWLVRYRLALGKKA